MALPIFPCSHPQSIVGANELNFCVRDGNRWTLIAINTNYMDKSSRSYRLIRPVARPICQSASRSNDLCILARNPRPVKNFSLPRATQRRGRERKRRAKATITLSREQPSEAVANGKEKQRSRSLTHSYRERPSKAVVSGNDEPRHSRGKSLAVFRMNGSREDLVTRTGFEPMLKA